MATSSASLTPSSSGSGSYKSFSSHHSSLLSTISGALRPRSKGVTTIDASVYDHSHNNTIINHGQMNNAYGNNVVQNIHVGIDYMEVLVSNMTRSRNAEFDMIGKVQREICTPETCQYILKDLKKWCRRKAAQLLFWLSGMPGTGKTTIVYTLCHYLRKHDLLGASFFCSRSVNDCQDLNLIFPTIAFQLAQKFPKFRLALGDALRKDPDIAGRLLHVQLKRLIIEPFKAQEEHLPSELVVVLDALDECSGDVALFLRTLVQYNTQLPFRLLLTSRPECGIHNALGSKDPAPVAEKFVIDEVDKRLVREDIVRFLRSKLPPLPDESINALADYSGSTFILAATVVRLAMDAVGSPSERLQSILDAVSSRTSSDVPVPLDMLYTEILSRVSAPHGGVFEREVEGIKDIVFTVICARDPLTREGMGVLWGLNEVTVEERLKRLRSVIFLPEDKSKPITVFHASFVDYLTDKARSGQWYCEEALFHDRLAGVCFRTMNKQLQQNICNLEGRPGNEEISKEAVETHIGPGLAYACMNWVQHIELSRALEQPEVQGSSTVVGEAEEFASRHLFHWIECISILGCLSIYERALDILEGLLKGTRNLKLELVRETREFVRLNYDIINYSANETYFSSLIWVPTESLLRTQFAELWRRPDLPQTLHGLDHDWGKASKTVKIHSNGIRSLVVTNGGTRVVSGSADATIRIWDALSHKEDRFFSGHADGISCIALSSDGHIFSASRDMTIRVWDIDKSEPILVFRGHSAAVESVTVSSDGKLVCSCDRSGNIMVWDPQTAELVRTLQDAGSTSRSSSVVFMPNSHLVSISFTEIQIWNAATGAATRSFNGHEHGIEAIATCAKGMKMITGSSDMTAKVWNASGKKLRTLRGHTETVKSVAFLHDGHRAATGSADKTIRIWSIESGETLILLTGHAQVVWSLAVFPDDRQIVSGSWEGTMMFWNIPESSGRVKRRWNPWSKKAHSHQESKTNVWSGMLMASSRKLLCLYLHKQVYLLDTTSLKQQSTITVGRISSAAFSSQVSRLATAGDMIVIWDISTKRQVLAMNGHSSAVTSITFSHDDKWIATGSIDGTARIWCATTGAELRILPQPRIVYSVAFSPDDMILATSSDSKQSIQLWDSKTGDDLEEPSFGRTILAYSADFSNDGGLIVGSTQHSTLAWNAQTGEQIRSLDGHKSWTCLPSGVSYTVLHNSWICKANDLASTPPAKLFWIPPKYRPLEDKQVRRPVAFFSASGDRIVLANGHDTVVISLPVV